MHGQRSALHHASSPVNGVACLHVDLAVPNFGIQEWMEFELAPGALPERAARRGRLRRAADRARASASSFDEEEARKRPSRDARLPQRYWPDGSVGDY